MSQQTNATGGSITHQQQAETSSDRTANSAPGGGQRNRDMHPQTREALAQAVKRAALQAKRR